MTTVLYGLEPENTYLNNYTLYLFYSKLIYQSLFFFPFIFISWRLPIIVNMNLIRQCFSEFNVHVSLLGTC